MTWAEFNERMSKVFEEFGGCWAVDEDNEGQVVIYTGLREKDGKLVHFEED